jgi:hypothetical protein
MKRLNTKGFFWNIYAPYLIDIKERNLTETFVYIINAFSDEKGVELVDNQRREAKKFYGWTAGFSWNG